MLRGAIDIAAACLCAALTLSAIAGGAVADDDPPPGKGAPPWQEVSAGAEATRNSWSAYSTLTVAPFSTIDVDGFRLRTSGGYGRYRYEGFRDIGKSRVPTEFGGITSFTDLMLGYQMQIARTTLKGFLGGAGITHLITPNDRENAVTGLAIGFKATIETWTDLTDEFWLSADGSWTQAHETYGSRVRGGWRVLPEVSIGAEAGLHGNATFDGGRGGLFVRYAPDWGEISISGGVMGDIDKPDAPYGSLNVLLKY